MIPARVRTTVNRVLKRQLAAIGFERADLAEDVDHDGDPILRIIVHYKRVGDSVDPTPIFTLAGRLREALAEVGEDRFPHFQHLLPDDQEVKVA
jgi:hypothetical protein